MSAFGGIGRGRRLLPPGVALWICGQSKPVADVFATSPNAADIIAGEDEEAWEWVRVDVPLPYIDISSMDLYEKTLPALRRAYDRVPHEKERLQSVRKWFRKMGARRAMESAPLLMRPYQGGLYVLDGWHRMVVWDEVLGHQGIPALVGFEPGDFLRMCMGAK